MMSICNFLIFRTVRASKRKVESNRDLGKFSSSQDTVMDTDVISHSSSDKGTLVRQSSSKTKIFLVSSKGELSNIDEVTIQLPPESNGTSDEKKVKHQQRKQRKISRGKARNEEVRLAIALGIVVLVFFICWFPFCISMLLAIFLPGVVPRGFHMATLLLGYANSGVNPIIYGVMNKKFGDGFKRIFCFVCYRIQGKSFEVR